MNLAKTLMIAGGGWLAWEALKSVTGAVVKVQNAKALPGMSTSASDDYPGRVDASQGADVASPSQLLPPAYGPMGMPTSDPLPVAIPVAFNPPDAPATIVANNPSAANPPASSVLPSTTPVQSPTLPDLNPTPSTPASSSGSTSASSSGSTSTPAPTPTVTQVSPYSAAGAGRLAPGQSLAAGNGIYSPNGRYLMHLVSDGLLAFKEPKGRGTLWQSNTRDMGVVRAFMNPAGYLQLVKADGTIVRQWGNGTANSAIHVTDGGRMVLYSPAGAVIWSVS